MALTRLQPAALQPSSFSGLNITDGSLYPVDLSVGSPTWDTLGNTNIGTAFSGTKTTTLRLGNSGVGGGVVTSTIALGSYGTGYGANIVSSTDFGATTGSYLAFGTTPAGATGGAAPTERARVDSAGNVLIGINSAYNTSRKLQVANGMAVGNGLYTYAAFDTNSTGDVILTSNANPANLGSNSNIVFKLGTSGGGGPSEVMRIVSNGTVKLTGGAQQSPATTTDITATSILTMTAGGGDNLSIGQYSGSNFWIQASYATNPSLAYYNIVMQPLGGAVLIGDATSVGSSNCVGLRKGSTGQLILMANNGGLYHQAVGSYYLVTTAGGSTSDATLKKNVVQLTGALEKVKAIRGVNFEFIDEPMCTADQGSQLGVIAQEVEAQYPEIVLTNEDGKKTVRYDRLVAPLIEAIKEQQTIIEQLTVRIEALENK